jgi:hypothetical protein
MTEMRGTMREAPPASEAPATIELPPPRSKRRGGVRRKAVDPRAADLHLRTTPSRKAEISAAAKAAGMTVTDYLLDGKVKHGRGMTAAPMPQPAFTADPLILVRMLAELGKWGGNWNQLAHRRNLTGEEPAAKELRRIGEALWDIRCAVLGALGREC